MINLLPPQAKKRVHTEYWVRVFTVAFVALSLALVMVVLMAAPIYISIQSAMSQMHASVQSAEQQSASIEANIATVEEANRKVQHLLSEDVAFPLTAYINAVKAQTNDGVDITAISLARADNGNVNEIQVGAIGRDRQAVLDFLDTLSAHQMFGEVDVPLSSLAQSTAIEFSVTIPVTNNPETDVDITTQP